MIIVIILKWMFGCFKVIGLDGIDFEVIFEISGVFSFLLGVLKMNFIVLFVLLRFRYIFVKLGYIFIWFKLFLLKSI